MVHALLHYTSAKLLDIAHKSYGFNADLIEIIN